MQRSQVAHVDDAHADAGQGAHAAFDHAFDDLRRSESEWMSFGGLKFVASVRTRRLTKEAMLKHANSLLTIALAFMLTTPATRAETLADVAPVAVAAPVNVITHSGLSYMLTKQAKGRHAQPGDMFYANYTLLLTNGKKIDSSYDRGQPFGFAVGAGQVIKGMDEVALKLGLGDEAVVVIPSSLGYGDKGGGPIPPGATLVFLMQVVEIRSK